MEDIFKNTPQEEQSNKDKINLLASQGFNNNQIALKVGCSRQYVGKVLKEYVNQDVNKSKQNVNQISPICKPQCKLNPYLMDYEDTIKGLILAIQHINKTLWIKDNAYKCPFGSNIHKLAEKIKSEMEAEHPQIEAETPQDEEII